MDPVDNPKAARIIEYLKRIPGFAVRRTSVAPHCGVLYVFFSPASNTTLRDAVRVCLALHGHVSVGLDHDGGGVLYQMSVGNNFEHALRVLQGRFNPEPRAYQCPSCLAAWKRDELNENSVCRACGFQLDLQQDAMIPQ